ncbi:MAG: hypothetical protein DHS20C05_06770 [Hyphococcus sp.]|nr:MAG: hypothetical protein DHS20C05_06770 [Marinicaulis sp.]
MPHGTPSFNRMSLFCETTGERKYLNRSERKRFYEAVALLPDLKDQTFVLMIYWTGCRPSEALGLSAMNIDLDDAMVIIRSLKKRDHLKSRHFRMAPVPREFVAFLDAVHGISAAQHRGDGGASVALWNFSRTTGWRRVRQVMQEAEISGAKCSAKGLRHSFGVLAALNGIPQSRIQYWLGHSNLETTAIYIDLAIAEDRQLARQMWIH